MGGVSARAFALMCVLALLEACSVRSISDSGYRDNSGWASAHSGNPLYRGELSEFDVLGVARDQAITDDVIRAAFVPKQPMVVKKGDSIMLIQSGAMFPDDGMMKALSKYYTVVAFSGVPDRPAAGPASPTTAQSQPRAAATTTSSRIGACWKPRARAS